VTVREPHPIYGPEWNKSKICEWCGAEGTCFIRYIPGVDVHVASLAKDILYKNRLCAKCYGPIAPTTCLGTFNALFVARRAKEWTEAELFPHYDSFHIYEIVSPRQNRAWAWAVVSNGNWQDIREIHIRSSLEDGCSVAREISLEDLTKVARKEWDQLDNSIKAEVFHQQAAKTLGFIE